MLVILSGYFLQLKRRQNCIVTFQRCFKVIKTAKYHLWATCIFWSPLTFAVASVFIEEDLFAPTAKRDSIVLGSVNYSRGVSHSHCGMLTESFWAKDFLCCLVLCWLSDKVDFWKQYHFCARSTVSFSFWHPCLLTQCWPQTTLFWFFSVLWYDYYLIWSFKWLFFFLKISFISFFLLGWWAFGASTSVFFLESQTLLDLSQSANWTRCSVGEINHKMCTKLQEHSGYPSIWWASRSKAKLELVWSKTSKLYMDIGPSTDPFLLDYPNVSYQHSLWFQLFKTPLLFGHPEQWRETIQLFHIIIIHTKQLKSLIIHLHVFLHVRDDADFK